MARGPSGHLEQLPSGGFRVAVYAGTDPLTGRRLRYRRTVKTEQQARIALGRLLEQASAGAPPDSGVTVAELLARYMEVAELEPSTREVRRLYPPHDPAGAWLDAAAQAPRPCTGHVLRTAAPLRGPDLHPADRSRSTGNSRPFPSTPDDGRPAWHQAADALRAAIAAGPAVTWRSASLSSRTGRPEGDPGSATAARPGRAGRRGSHHRPAGTAGRRYPRADLGQLLRLLIHPDIDPGPRQRNRRRDPANPAADNHRR